MAAPSAPGVTVKSGHCKRIAPGDSVPVDLYFELLHLGPSSAQGAAAGDEQRIVMIMGFAATCRAWYPLLHHLDTYAHASGTRYQVLIFDNRGIGASSSPPDPKAYTTAAMAQDALAVMDNVGWLSPVHVVGFSMGGMISTKLAAAAPSRVRSLCIVGVSGGGWDIIPRSLRAWKYALRSMRAKTVEERSAVSLKFHFCRATLKATVPGHNRTAKDMLMRSYVEELSQYPKQPEARKLKAAAPLAEHVLGHLALFVPQNQGPPCLGPPLRQDGRKGQSNACWQHKVTGDDVDSIRRASFPVVFVHGRHDIVAGPKFGQQQAERLQAPCVLLEGGHFVPRERASEVCALMLANMCRPSCGVGENMLIGGHHPNAKRLLLAQGAQPALTTPHLAADSSGAMSKEEEHLLRPMDVAFAAA